MSSTELAPNAPLKQGNDQRGPSAPFPFFFVLIPPFNFLSSAQLASALRLFCHKLIRLLEAVRLLLHDPNLIPPSGPTLIVTNAAH